MLQFDPGHLAMTGRANAPLAVDSGAFTLTCFEIHVPQSVFNLL